MNPVVPRLYASPPEAVPFGPSLEIRAFVLERQQGNLLIYRADTLRGGAAAITELGGLVVAMAVLVALDLLTACSPSACSRPFARTPRCPGRVPAAPARSAPRRQPGRCGTRPARGVRACSSRRPSRGRKQGLRLAPAWAALAAVGRGAAVDLDTFAIADQALATARASGAGAGRPQQEPTECWRECRVHVFGALPPSDDPAPYVAAGAGLVARRVPMGCPVGGPIRTVIRDGPAAPV
jgi:hypothetical protein